MLAAMRKVVSICQFIVNHPLSNGRKIKAVWTFFSWQIGWRILRKKVIFPWVDDSKFVVGLGETGLTGNIYVGLMEYESMSFLLHTLRPTDIFVDVGANAGAYTILASKVVQARSIAFEPVPETVHRLQDQLRVNGIDSIVDVRAIGVGDKKGSLFFRTDHDTMNKVSFSRETDNERVVDITKLDDEISSDNYYFIKIDVEGFEYQVIEGAAGILSSGHVLAIIVELNSDSEVFGHTNEETHRKICEFGFFPVSYDPAERSIKPYNGYKESNSNTLYIRDMETFSRRSKAARSNTIHTACNISL